MKRSSLFVCCGITLLYLSDRLDSRTVSPIVYLTTAIPNVADPTGYYDGGVRGQSGHYEGGVRGQSGYYGGGAGGKAGYYGGVGAQSRNYGDGSVGQTGHYGGRSTTAAAATMYGSYGHRTMPESAVRGAIRPVRDDRSYALYESPNTYEYMMNPPRKSGKVSRVPETERLPPGDDVEFIDDGGGGDNRRPAKDRRRDGNGGEQSQDVDDRPRGYHQNNNSNNKRINRNKPKAKSGKKLPAREDDYTNDGGGGGGVGDAESVGSSTTDEVREGATPKKPRRDGYEEVGRKNKSHGPSGDGPVKHKIHKKNEYSKRQQFFDEEHVDHGKKKPKNKYNHYDGHKNNGHEIQKQSKKKKRQQQQKQQPRQQQRSTQKPVKRTTKSEKKDDQGTSRVVPQGYGQVVAVR